MADPQQIAAALNFYDSKKSLDPFAQQNSGERVLPTLANIYSAIDSAKRKGSDFVRNPVESLQQIVGYGMDKANAARDQLYQATEEEGINYGPKTKALAKLMAENYNPVGMFIGPNAASFNKIMATKALDLEKAGKSAKEIWEETGTFRGPDKQLRQEISDKGSKITEDVYNQISANKQFTGPMGQALQHEELYKAYPQTARIPTVMYADETPYGSVLRGKEGTFQVPQITVGGPSSMSQRSTGLHEIQHAIQQKEGFARGGNLNEYATGPMFDKTARDLTADLSQVVTGGVSAKPLEVLQGLKYTDPKDVEPIIKKYGFKNIDEVKSFIYDQNERRTPLGQYLRTAGEAEARATQKRRNLTNEERRAIFPLESYDVPINELIFK